MPNFKLRTRQNGLNFD